ncbi:MAG: chloride channel protein [Pedobacter sp.]|nr:chloride channel protein [Pedobacter sp.]
MIGALVFAKLVAFVLTVSSGGSGGVFAPTLYVGGMIGALVAHVFHQPPAGFVIVGMAALFSGAARVPIAALLMVPEMTGGYQILVPAALAVSLSYLLQTTLSANLKYRSLYEAQVPFREDSGAHRNDYINLAFNLLSTNKGVISDNVKNLDLVALFRSKMPIGIPKGKRLSVIKVKPDAAYAHELFRADYFTKSKNHEVEIITMIRQGKPFIPTLKTHLRPDDVLILLIDEVLFEKMEKEEFQKD